MVVMGFIYPWFMNIILVFHFDVCELWLLVRVNLPLAYEICLFHLFCFTVGWVWVGVVYIQGYFIMKIMQISFVVVCSVIV